MSDKVRLEDRPLSNNLCACGCGNFARQDSKLHSRACYPVYSAIAMREWRRHQTKQKIKEPSWPERREAIKAKFGIGQSKSS